MTDHQCPSAEKVLEASVQQVPIPAECKCEKKSLPIPRKEVHSKRTYRYNGVTFPDIQEYRRAKLRDVLKITGISEEDTRKLLDVPPNVLNHLVYVPDGDIVIDCTSPGGGTSSTSSSSSSSGTSASTCITTSTCGLSSGEPKDKLSAAIAAAGGLIEGRERVLKIRFGGGFAFEDAASKMERLFKED
jgi:hypothetical protein